MIGSFGRRQDCNASFLAGFHDIMHHILTGVHIILHHILAGVHILICQFFGRCHMTHYNVDAVLKPAQKLEHNCNSLEILKVRKYS